MLILKLQFYFRFNFLYWKALFPSIHINLDRVKRQGGGRGGAMTSWLVR